MPSVAGGSEVYGIDSNGYARKLWSHASELVYSIVLDAQDRPLIATGNRGGLYRLDSMQRYTLVETLAPTQVTQLVAARGNGGAIYAVTGNIGKLYQIGPGLENDGVFESDVLDAAAFTYWGRISYEGHDRVAIETRSGNMNDAHKNWSPWTAPSGDGRVQSPAARFLQYRLTLAASAEVDTVDVKFQAKNIAPVVEQVEVTPPNYKFPAPAATTSTAPVSPATLNLPAIGQKRSNKASGAAAASGESTATVNYAKGFAGVRWAVGDDNGDTLVYRVEIRGVSERDWKLLRDKIRERYYSWDSTAFADGEYVVRITASDSPSNTPEASLSASLESDPFLVDNTPPVIQGLTASVTSGKLNISFQAKDALSNIVRAEYSLNGGDWTIVEPVTRLSDAKELNYRFAIDAPAGESTVAVRVTDEFDNQSVSKVAGK